MRRTLAFALCAVLSGCGSSERAQRQETRTLAGSATAAAPRPTLGEIDQRCYAFADRYAVVLASAVEDICRDEPDLRRRREAHLLRVGGVSGIYDVATGRDPFTKLLDLTLVVTLQSRRWIDELEAERAFGPEKGRTIALALRRLRVEVWELAAQALTPEQLQELDSLISTWRRDNPTVDGLTFVRFDDVGASRGRALADEVRGGGGLFAPVDRAVDVAEQTRQLGERLFWLSKRSPTLLTWQFELAADDLLLRPEVAKVSDTVTGLPAFFVGQREAALRDLATVSDRVGSLLDRTQGLVTGVTPVVGDVRAATASVAETAAAAERLVHLLAPPPGSTSKPFDVTEYTAALTQANVTLTEANTTLNSVNGLLSGGALSARLQEFNSAATDRLDHVTKRVDEVSWFLVWRGIALMASFFVLLGAYRWWAARWMRK